jgi:hypothetical protein
MRLSTLKHNTVRPEPDFEARSDAIVVAAPRLGSEDFVTANPEALGISAGERGAEAAARCQAKVAYAGLCVDTRVRDLASDKVVAAREAPRP